MKIIPREPVIWPRPLRLECATCGRTTKTVPGRGEERVLHDVCSPCQTLHLRPEARS